jgi:D-amino-acid dehydrogenase
MSDGSYDAIVVGGGVVGLSTAYYLVRRGASTALIDNGQRGRASDAGAGILSTSPDSAADPYEHFRTRAVRAYPELVEELAAAGETDVGYGRCGGLTVAASADEAASFERLRAAVRGLPDAVAAGYAELTGAQALELFPPLAPVRSAIHCAADARIDGRLLAGALRRVACASGLDAREAEVSDLMVGHGALHGVSIGHDELRAGHIVIAAGAWSKALGERIGLRIPVGPQRGQILHLDLPDTDTGNWPLIKAFRGHYMVPWPGGRVVVGATRESVGFKPRTTVTGIMEVLSEAVRVAPGLKHASVAEIRVGLRPASADGQPILGAVPGIANLWLATGHGAVGLQLGPYSGRMLAESILRGEPQDAIAPFALERFR